MLAATLYELVIEYMYFYIEQRKTEMENSKPTSFQELVRTSERPVFVDFWAEWCAPCRLIAPSIHRLAEETEGRLIVTKINVDEEPDLAMQYRVQSIPTLMMFYRGKPIGHWIGALPYGRLKTEVEDKLQSIECEAVQA
jgi:thioredoxin